ncbi:MAG: ORF6N domain-containing protein [Planctomycetota bacterium]|jgi:hypothetical protein|nr:ORF6N domain-containing protein [Planctomycetota bacterium]
MAEPDNVSIPSSSPIASRIYSVRDQAVMLDSDLAAVYEVTTKQLNQAIKRNGSRFPETYSFQLSQNEWDALRSQIVTLKIGRGQHRKYLPRVFTEHGAIALAMVLNSERAIKASEIVINAFVRLRHALYSNRELAWKVDKLGAQVDEHRQAIAVIFHELDNLTRGVEPEQPKERIGFRPNEKQER